LKKKIFNFGCFKTTPPTPWVNLEYGYFVEMHLRVEMQYDLKQPENRNGLICVKFWKRFFCTHPPLPKFQPAIIANFGAYVQHIMHPNRTFFLARQLLVAHTMPIYTTFP
jgi:hypothetical protein